MASTCRILLTLLLTIAFCGVAAAESLTAEQVRKLLARDGAASDLFGVSVSVDGDTAVIGARLDDDNGSASGSAYVFVRSGRAWTQQAKLLADDGAAFDQFGGSVSVDGDTAVIGAFRHDGSGPNSGRV